MRIALIFTCLAPRRLTRIHNKVLPTPIKPPDWVKNVWSLMLKLERTMEICWSNTMLRCVPGTADGVSKLYLVEYLLFVHGTLHLDVPSCVATRKNIPVISLLLFLEKWNLLLHILLSSSARGGGWHPSSFSKRWFFSFLMQSLNELFTV